MKDETYMSKIHVNTLLDQLSYISALFKAEKIEHLDDWAESHIAQAADKIDAVYKHLKEMTSATSDKVLTLYEYQEFLDFNDFGPSDGSDNPKNSEMTLSDFLNLPHFEKAENVDKAIQSLTVNEDLEIEMLDNCSIIIKSSDNEKVTVVVDKLEMDFVKEDLLNALHKKLAELEEVVENKITSDEPQSVLKFKQYISINKL